MPNRLIERMRSLRIPLRWLLLGLVIRLSIAPFTYARDFWFFVAGTYYTSMNLQSLFTLQFWSYPPPHLWVLVGLYRVWLILPISHNLLVSGSISELSRGYIPASVHDFLVNPSLVLAFKLPNIAADVLTGIVILKGLTELGFGEASARLGFKLWMLNPVVIWISSASGHFDAIPTFFACYALICVVSQKFSRAALSLGLGGAWKLWPFLLLPIFVALQRDDGARSWMSLRKQISTISLTLAPIAFITILYLLFPSTTYLKEYTPSNFPEGFGVLLGYIIPIQPLGYWLGGIPLTFTLFMIFLLVMFHSVTKNRLEIANGLVLAELLLFLSLSPISDQYVIWALPFVTLDLMLYRKHLPLLLVIAGVMLIHLVLALNNLGFGFYFASIVPQSVYDWLNSLAVNPAVTEGLRGLFVATSFYYGILTLGPLFLARFKENVFSAQDQA